MNYYEELGVSQQATEPEIRKAHRRLVKLMHPDAQPDQSLKMMAETQMRRLNSIVSTLLDPDQRRSYDEQLRVSEAPPRSGSALESWRGIPWWLASAAGTVVLTLVAVWLWADHLGSTYGSKSAKTMIIPPAENPSMRAAGPASLPASATGSSNDGNRDGASYASPAQPNTGGSGISATVVSDPPPVTKSPAKQDVPVPVVPEKPQVVVVVPPPDPKKQSVAKTVENKPTVARTEPPHKPASVDNAPTLKAVALPDPKPRKVFSLPSGTLLASAAPAAKNLGSQLPAPPGVYPQSARDYNSGSIPAPPLPAAMPPPKAADVAPASTTGTPVARSSSDPLEGEWVYAPKEPERRRAGFYPPEYIDLKLFGSGDPGSLKGQYSAKYVVTDRPVSSEISFELASASKGSRKFLWQSNSGAKGTLSIDPIDDRTIRIDWHTTSAIRGPALTSGQATLVRRQ